MLPLVNPLCGSDLGNLSVTFFNCYSFCLAPDQEIQGLYLRRAEAAEDVNNANHSSQVSPPVDLHGQLRVRSRMPNEISQVPSWHC